MVKRKLRSMVELKEFLKNPSPNVKVPVYTEEEKRDTNSGDHTVKKPTLSQRLDELTKIVVDGFKRVNTRIDNLEKDTNSRFDRIEARIEAINTRLDYIVDANNLKDIPSEKR